MVPGCHLAGSVGYDCWASFGLLASFATWLVIHIWLLAGSARFDGHQIYMLVWLAGCLAAFQLVELEHPWTKSRCRASFIFARSLLRPWKMKSESVHSLQLAVVLAVGRSTEMRVHVAPVELSSVSLSGLYS